MSFLNYRSRVLTYTKYKKVNKCFYYAIISGKYNCSNKSMSLF